MIEAVLHYIHSLQEPSLYYDLKMVDFQNKFITTLLKRIPFKTPTIRPILFHFNFKTGHI